MDKIVVIPKELPAMMRKLRQERGLSLRQAGDRIGCTYALLSMWERGLVRVDTGSLTGWGKALGVEITIGIKVKNETTTVEN